MRRERERREGETDLSLGTPGHGVQRGRLRIILLPPLSHMVFRVPLSVQVQYTYVVLNA